MKRQRVRTNRETGVVETFYEDKGRGRAVRGHGRPTLVLAVRSNGIGQQQVLIGAGHQQLRLSSGNG